MTGVWRYTVTESVVAKCIVACMQSCAIGSGTLVMIAFEQVHTNMEHDTKSMLSVTCLHPEMSLHIQQKWKT